MKYDNIAFIDLKAQQARIEGKISAAIARVLDHGQYIFGPEVNELEEKLSVYMGVADTISCSSGTDALLLPLMAWEIGPGDAVFVPSFTFAATAEVVSLVGATPVFVDILEDTFNMDVEHLKLAIDEVRAEGTLTPRAIIAVDLFGQLASYPGLKAIADDNNLKIISDAAQSFGATLDDKHPNHWADVVTTSFFPAKPLACYGDGGAIMTDDEETAAILRSLRNHGQGGDKYDNVRIGINGRLDTIQAAILLEKFAIFEDELVSRDKIANRYTEKLNGSVIAPVVPDGHTSTWAEYTIRVPERAKVVAHLRDMNIPTAIYYPNPLHKQTAFKSFPIAANGLPVTDRVAKDVLSIPMHPYLEENVQDYIVDTIQTAVANI